jgi:hypothetical protein
MRIGVTDSTAVAAAREPIRSSPGSHRWPESSDLNRALKIGTTRVVEEFISPMFRPGVFKNYRTAVSAEADLNCHSTHGASVNVAVASMTPRAQ